MIIQMQKSSKQQQTQNNMSSISSSVQSKKNNKVILLGDSGVGKTALIHRFTHNKFDSAENATIGIDFVGKNVSMQGCNYRLQLWDTAGQQRYRSLIPSYLKDAISAIFVFDITKPESLDNLQGWIQLYKQSKTDKSHLLICANKIDLKQKQNYSEEKLKFLMDKHGMKVYYTSALNAEGVNEMFEKIIQSIHSKQEKKKKRFDDAIDLLPYSSQNLHQEDMKSNRSQKTEQVQPKTAPEDTRIKIKNEAKPVKIDDKGKENVEGENVVQGGNRCC